MTFRNDEQVGKALRLLGQGLYPYVKRQMQATYGEAWLAKVENTLPKDYTLKRTSEEAVREDIYVLLTVISRQWDKVFKPSLSQADRALVSELIEVRHKWAHQLSFSTEDTYRALDSMVRLLATIGATEAEAIAQQRQTVLRVLLEEQASRETRRSPISEQEVKIRAQLQDLLKRLPFKDAGLLYRALTHRSYIFEHPTETLGDNEQLEFLGDSILGFLAGDYLYQRNSSSTEQDLTNRRSNLVENSRLATFARKWELGKWLLLSKGEASTGGRERPSLLSNAFEAVIGAYYLDSGIEAVRALVEPLFETVVEVPTASNSCHPATASTDPKGQLQQYALAHHEQLPVYVVVSETGSDHEKVFTVQVQIAGKLYGAGTGRSKKEAEKQAAITALKQLGLQ